MIKKAIIYLMYWDMNNLYDYSMSKRLPQKDLQWVENKMQFLRLSDKEIILQLEDDTNKGYI